jgi:hypothetical protein
MQSDSFAAIARKRAKEIERLEGINKELLEACRAIETILGVEMERASKRELEVRWECIREAIEEAQTAIAKAEGK